MTSAPTAPWREPFTFRGVAYTVEVPNPINVGSAIFGAHGNEFLAKVVLVMHRLRRGNDLVFPEADATRIAPDDLALIQAAWLAVSPFTMPNMVDLSHLGLK